MTCPTNESSGVRTITRYALTGGKDVGRAVSSDVPIPRLAKLSGYRVFREDFSELDREEEEEEEVRDYFDKSLDFRRQARARVEKLTGTSAARSNLTCRGVVRSLSGG